MKKLLSGALALALLLTLAACGSPAVTNEEPDEKADEDSYEEQYELGIKYLEDGNYEEAILAFTATIEIDPKRTEAYSGLADTYIKMGDFDKAMEALQQGVDATSDEKLVAWLEKLQKGNVSDSSGRTYKTSHYDADGSLKGYLIFGYNADGRDSSATIYDAKGVQQDYFDDFAYDDKGNKIRTFSYSFDSLKLAPVEYSYNADGNRTRSTSYEDDGTTIAYSIGRTYDTAGNETSITWYNADGTRKHYRESSYDATGKETRSTFYDADGTMTGYGEYSYDADGNRTRSTSYEDDGTMTGYVEISYDADGNQTGNTQYDADGKVLESETYN